MNETVNQTNVGRHLPSDIEQVLTVARYDVLKHLRSRRLLGILVIAALVIVAYMAIPPALGDAYSKDAREFASGFISMMPTIIVVIATLFAGDAIVSEFQNRTGYLLFPNPVKRSTLYIGKYLAAVALAVFILLVYYGLVALLTVAVTGGLTDKLLYSLGLAVLYACATIALGFLLSSVLKGSTGSLVLTFVLLILIMPMISGILSIAPANSDFLLSTAGDSTIYMMQDPYPQSYTQTIDAGAGQTITIGVYYIQPWTAVAVMGIYAVVCFTLGYLAFKRREMVS
ncbi:MAG: ABC-2 family transporter protein [Methanomassiliicoccales archaeon PtaU1.Bin124]|nr:MAG: ABC-2 family transporter protein [Methanomassiliicoccales archaeon PtaU1.Bin124]